MNSYLFVHDDFAYHYSQSAHLITFYICSETFIRSIEDAIKAFLKIEKLTTGNEWKCHSCNENVQATKQMVITKAPNILVLHLKRFSYELRKRKKKKMNVIQFDPKLQLNCIDKNDEEYFVLYELIGVIVHVGKQPDMGHYRAYVKVKRLILNFY